MDHIACVSGTIDKAVAQRAAELVTPQGKMNHIPCFSGTVEDRAGAQRADAASHIMGQDETLQQHQHKHWENIDSRLARQLPKSVNMVSQQKSFSKEQI